VPTPNQRARQRPDPRGSAAALLLVATAAAGLLPGWFAPLGVLAGAAAWIALRPPRREAVAVGAAALLAVTALVWAHLAAGPVDVDDADWQRAARRAYAATWETLDAQAAEAGRAIADGALAGEDDAGEAPEASDLYADDRRLAAFRVLAALAAEGGEGRQTLLLLDPDGEPVAWAGEGLLHELRVQDMPRQGRTHLASFGAVTTLSVAPLDDARRPWRTVAARSFATDELPFTSFVAGRVAGGLRWSLIGDPGEAVEGAVVIGVEATPSLVVEQFAEASPAPQPLPRRFAWWALGLALLTVAAMRGTGYALGAGRPDGFGQLAAVPLLVAGGGMVTFHAAGAAPAALAALVAGLAVALAGTSLALAGWSRSLPRGRWVALAAGAASVAALVVAAAASQLAVGPLASPTRFFVPPTVFALRLALAAAAFGLLAAAGGLGARRPPAGQGGERWAWLAAPLWILAAALCEQPGAALLLFACAAAATALWLAESRPRHLAGLALLALFAAVLAAGAWETTHRHLLRSELAANTLAAVGPPASDELTATRQSVNGFLREADLARYVPRSPAGLETEDLAYLLWQSSPLARADAVSRLTVRPFVGVASSFAFGLPEGELEDTGPAGWGEGLPVPVNRRLVEATAELTYGGEAWATVEWSLLQLPGYAVGGGEALEATEVVLLRGLRRRGEVGGLPSEVVFVHYDGTRRPYSSPWPEEPPLDRLLAGEEQTTAGVDTPEGDAWAVARPVADGWDALYLPRLGPRQALERVGTHALGILLVLFAVTLLALAAALPRAAFRDAVRRAVRSYSKRLLLVYTLLLLVPLLLLNVVLVAAVENRLREEQRASGEAALASAQRVLGTYLAALPPGFDLASELDDELLLWISQVLRHEINLYWGSEQWASSKPELFAARLLPKRIPGESFSDVAFLGYDLAARTNRVGDTSYLELYAPLRVPGEELGPRNFFLSMPLLAQQEEVARELANLRLQALLVTALLIALVSAVGGRLSRSFTRPLTELVEGTRRIAAGATSLDLSPSEVELAALVEAVDDMARRIAEGREKLLREKQVVERIVEHITSGVVSLDADGRVLMANRVAEDLLGVEVGERLGAALERQPRLEPLLGWLEGAAADGPGPGELAQRTVRLAPAAGSGDDGGDRLDNLSPEPEAGREVDGDESGGEREWTLVWVPVAGDGAPAALLVVEDATETLRGQRLEAWAEMARIIAHEIKNPLTPIRLNVEHLQQVWRDRVVAADDSRFSGVLDRTTANVLSQVEELRQIASEFSTYSRIPKIEPRSGDLVTAMRQLAEPYRAAPPPGVEFGVEAEPQEIEARFDERLLARAVRNLVENALRASAGGGRVVLRVERDPGSDETLAGSDETLAGNGGRPGAEARIRVLDSGPGIDPAILPRIFDPYFSTHDTGTGLGLPIARRIAEEHGGSMSARNRPEGGLEVTLTLPAS